MTYHFNSKKIPSYFGRVPASVLIRVVSDIVSILLKFFLQHCSYSVGLGSSADRNWFDLNPGDQQHVGKKQCVNCQSSLPTEVYILYGCCLDHGGIRYGELNSQRSHSNAYAVLSPLAATPLMAQTQSIIVTYTGFHAFGTRSQVWRRRA